MMSAAADAINHNGRKNRSIQTYTILLCKDDIGSIVEPKSSLVWADVILADFQKVISRYLQYISTNLSCTGPRVLGTIFMQKSKPKYACLPNKIVEDWIDRFCVRHDWWRLLQPTSSVSPVCWFVLTNVIITCIPALTWDLFAVIYKYMEQYLLYDGYITTKARCERVN